MDISRRLLKYLGGWVGKGLGVKLKENGFNPLRTCNIFIELNDIQLLLCLGFAFCYQKYQK